MSMSEKIADLKAREILDSRGNPTVEVEVILEGGFGARAAVPSGASTGAFEALELRDGEKERYGGQGVQLACRGVKEEIAPLLRGVKVSAQAEIDRKMRELDGTENKANLGANAMLGVSLAVARAAAAVRQIPLYTYLSELYGWVASDNLPVPMFNILNGGKHADNGLAVQEFMIVPRGVKGAAEQVRAGSEIFHRFKNLLGARGYATGVGDEGGFAPRLENVEEGLDFIMEAIVESGYRAGEEVWISLDVAANSFYLDKEEKYMLAQGLAVDGGQLTALYVDWLQKYPLYSIEDPINETDLVAWQALYARLKENFPSVVMVADDLTVTSSARLQTAAQAKAANSIIIKPNQIGTLSETVTCIKLAQSLNWKVIVSHRSGETCDDFIVDLAVAAGAEFLKAGSLSRGERLAKYNRLLAVADELSGKKSYDS